MLKSYNVDIAVRNEVKNYYGLEVWSKKCIYLLLWANWLIFFFLRNRGMTAIKLPPVDTSPYPWYMAAKGKLLLLLLVQNGMLWKIFMAPQLWWWGWGVGRLRHPRPPNRKANLKSELTWWHVTLKLLDGMVVNLYGSYHTGRTHKTMPIGGPLDGAAFLGRSPMKITRHLLNTVERIMSVRSWSSLIDTY